MLKKKDLMKEFELVVQQEITNHNRELLQTNTSINQLSDALIQLRKSHSSSMSQMDERVRNQGKTISKTLDNIKSFYDDITSKYVSIVNRFNKLETSLSEFEKKICNINDSILNISCRIEDVNKKFVNEINVLGNNCNNLNNNISSISSDFKSQLDKSMQDLRSKPIGLEDDIRDMAQKIKVSTVDREGLSRQLDVFRHQLFVIEKNVENIYNKIERLQKP